MALKNEFRTKYHPSLKNARTQVRCTEEEGRTKQEFAKDCDINLIMARYKKTGMLPPNIRAKAAQYGDWSQIPTYAEMHNKVIAARELFESLPAQVRKSFHNDPQEFIAAADTPEGNELLIKLGLATRPVIPSPSQPNPNGEAVKPAVKPAETIPNS